MDAKYKKLLWISIGLSLGIMLLVILFTFDEETLVALKNFDYRFLLIAFGLHLLAIVFWGPEGTPSPAFPTIPSVGAYGAEPRLCAVIFTFLLTFQDFLYMEVILRYNSVKRSVTNAKTQFL